jgi:DNA repair exonuclease SbcCD nuclease subunit
MRKLLCIGDPHFKVENTHEVSLFIERLETLAQDLKPDRIICLGDLLDTHERIHSLVMNTAYEFVQKMRQIAPTVVLVGNHDMCFGKDTRILLYDGSIKLSQDIQPGDVLVGPDNLPRIVSTITKGISRLYKVIQSCGMTYIVNEYHSLCVYDLDTKQFKEITITSFLQLSLDQQLKLKGYKTPERPGESTTNFPGTIQVELLSSLNVVEVPADTYYGWVVDADHKFLLQDRTVVHNCNNQQFLTTNHWMNGMKEWKNVTVVDKVIIDSLSGTEYLFPPVKLIYVPYVYPGKFMNALNTIGDEWEDADCIFAHQEFKGCKMGAIISEDGDEWPVDNPFVVSGHIHSSQTPQDNIYYPGSAMQHAFGESDKNHISLVTIDKGEISFEEIDLNLPRKKLVYKDVEDMDDYIVPETKDKIKIVVSGIYEQFKAFKKSAKYKSLISRDIKIVFKPKRLDPISKEKQAGRDPKTSGISFEEILAGLIKETGNQDLLEAYTRVLKTDLV